ncbi:MAG: enoyl-CoA hydratase/isomerase family protein [Spirochaetia bacterium]|nr:enoyl-CoA hydratase/isomerase family protein [Spirochaetia bacterium]
MLPFFEIEYNETKGYAILYLNRPEKRNSMNWPFWRDLPAAVDEIEKNPKIKVVLIAGRGKSFSTGLDLEDFFAQFDKILSGARADQREDLLKLILQMQEGFRRIMRSPKIFIACVHRHCIGGGLDLMCACDLRLASADAQVSLRETKVAIVADMGSLNRLPGIIGDGNTRLMAFTGADFSGEDCNRMGLVSKVYGTQEEMMHGARTMAEEIASNSGIVLRGVKHNINYQMDHTVTDGMNYVATYNAAFLDTNALHEMILAFKERRRPNFD